MRIHAPKKRLSLLLSFALPFMIYTCFTAIASFKPFGEKINLYADAYYQYYPFYLQFRNALRSGESLQWNWGAGTGTDYIGFIAYYAASPLNLLSVLMSESMASTYYFLLAPLKLSLAGLFMALLLKSLYKTESNTIPLFSCAYAFCGWAMGYSYDVMWLDGFALLPLAILGFTKLMRSDKPLLYTSILASILISSYYIGFFICIFIFLLFFCYSFCRWKGVKPFLHDLWRIALYSSLALGISAFLLLPAYKVLQNTFAAGDGYNANILSTYIIPKAEQAEISKLWESYRNATATGSPAVGKWFKAVAYTAPLFVKGIFTVMGNAFCGTTPTTMDGLPNVYSGTVVLLLAILFFFSHIPWKEKVCSGALLLFFLVGMVDNKFNYILHGFHFPNQLPYRFSFLFSFVIILMAYRTWLQIGTSARWKVLLSGGITAALLLAFPGVSEGWMIFNIVILVVATVALVFHRKSKATSSSVLSAQQGGEADSISGIASCRCQQVAAFILCLLFVAELVVTPLLSLANYGYLNEEFVQPLYYASAITKLLSTDDEKELFYRTEATPMTSPNGSALYGYNSVSTFSSTVNVRTTSFILSLGADCATKNNRAYYGHGSPVSNLFLNLKYLIDTNGAAGNDPFFDFVAEVDGITLSESNAYLPLGFMVGEKVKDLLFVAENGGSFDFQNRLFSAATGIEEQVWTKITPGEVIAQSPDLEEGTLSCIYTAQRTGVLAFHFFSLADDNGYSVYRNGELLFTDHINEQQQTVTIGSVEEGDQIRVEVPCPVPSEDYTISQLIRITGAILDETLFRQGYEILAGSTMTLTEFSNTYVAGTISCTDGLLYTSIPQDGNWSVYVDGQKAESELIGNCMIAVRLDSGSHTIEFRYRNSSFIMGCIISALSISIFVFIALLKRHLKNKKTATSGTNATTPSAGREEKAHPSSEIDTPHG